MAVPLTALPGNAGTPVDPTLERDAHQFYDTLSDLIRVYQFRDRDRICCYDVSVSQCYGLEALVRKGPMTLNDLAAYLYLDKSTASRVVDALERKGYVARAPHPDDGRASVLTRTELGTEMLRLSALIFERQHERWAELLGGERLGTLEDDLTALAGRTPGSAMSELPGWFQ